MNRQLTARLIIDHHPSSIYHFVPMNWIAQFARELQRPTPRPEYLAIEETCQRIN
jgi:hypothetical protein